MGITFLAGLQGKAADIVWTNASSGNWGAAVNWKPNQVPGTSDHASITNAGNYTVTVSANASVASFNLGASSGTQNLALSGGTFTISGVSTASANGVLILSGGTLNGGTVNLPGGATLMASSSGGTLNNVTINGDLTLASDSARVIIAGTTSFQNARLSGDTSSLGFAPGTILTGNVLFEGANAGNRFVEMNGGSGTLTIGTNGSIKMVPGFAGTGQIGPGFNFGGTMMLINNGLISAEASGRTLTVAPASLANNGIAQALGGATLTFSSGAYANSGTISVNAATLNLGGTFNATGGIGIFSNTGGTINITGTINNGALTLNSATGSWNLLGGTISGGSISNAAGQTLVMTTSGGTLNNVTVIGDLTLAADGARVIITGTTSFQNARLSGDNSSLGFAPGTILTGNVLFEGANAGNRWVEMNGNSGTFTIGPSGSIRMLAGFGGTGQIGPGFNSGGNMTLINNGLISAEASGRTLVVAPAGFANNGTARAIGGATLTFNPGAAYVNVGTISVNAATVNLGGTFNATTGIGTFGNTGGTINIIGTMNNGTLILNSATGSWNLLGGTISGGSISNAAGQLLVMTSSGGTLSNVTVNGDLSLAASSARVIIAGTASFQNARLSGDNSSLGFAPGTILTGNVLFEGANAGNRWVEMNGNTGTFTIGPSGSIRMLAGFGGTGQVGPGFNFGGNMTLINNGLISAETSGRTLNVAAASFTNNGSARATGGATLTLSSSAYANNGTFSVNAATLNLGGTFNATGGIGTFSNTGGTINITGTMNNGAATLNSATGSWNLLGGTVSGGSISFAFGQTLVMTSSGGTLTNVTVNGDLTLATSGARVIIAGTTSFQNARLSGNPSSLGFAPGTILTGNVLFEGASGGSRFVEMNGDSGTFTIGTNGSIRMVAGFGGTGRVGPSNFFGGDMTLINNGLLSAEASGRTLTIAPATSLTSDGRVESRNGSLMSITSLYVQTAGRTLLEGGNLTVSQPFRLQGGTLAGTNTLTGSVISDGLVNPGPAPGLLTITGNYTQTTNGMLLIELAGTASSKNFDRLAVGGTATLAGTLGATLTNGFYPAANAVFTFLTCASRIGAFATFDFSANDLGLRVNYTTTNATIQVTNVRPTVAATKASVTFAEGTIAANTGTFSDPAGAIETVTIGASRGAVTQSGNGAGGTWSWSLLTTNSPAESGVITITATDSHGVMNATTFMLIVTNVSDAPAGTDRSVTLVEDTAYNLSVTDFGFSDLLDTPANNFARLKITTLPGAGTLTFGGSPVLAGAFLKMVPGPAGATWTAQASGSRAWFSIASSADGTKLAAVEYGGQIYTSMDSGTNWTARASGSRDWWSIASSTDGTKLAAVANGGQIYTSVDGGTNWTAQASGSRNWLFIASSADGTKLAAVEYGGPIYTSVDGGTNWTAQASGSGLWNSIASSTDGKKLAAGGDIGPIYTSVDGGTNWTAQASGSGNWLSIASSADGKKLVAGEDGGQFYTSVDGGTNWTVQVSDSGFWNSIVASADGKKLAAVDIGGPVYTSVDGGTNWVARASGDRNWNSIASSADGSKLAAAEFGGQISTSVGLGFDLTYTPAPNASGSPYAAFTFQVEDDGTAGGAILDPTPNTLTFNVTSLSDAPVLAVNLASVTTGEGLIAINTGTFSDAEGNASVTLSNSVGVITPNNGAGTWSWSHSLPDNLAGPTTVTITANDGVTTPVTTTFTLTVTNRPPTVVADNLGVTVGEGRTATNTGTFSDPAGTNDTVTLSASRGVVTPAGNGAGGTWSWILPATNSPIQSGTITITASDGEGGVRTTSFVLTVTNIAPTLELGANTNLPSGLGTLSRNITFSDPASGETYSGTVDYGDGRGAQALSINSTTKSFMLTRTYTNNGTFRVSATVNDGGGGSASDSFFVTVSVLPEFTTQPVSRTNECGTLATFNVVVAGPGPFSYQWFFSPTNLVFTNSIAGATNDTLMLTANGVSEGLYHVVVGNFNGNVRSQSAALKVINISEPQITGCPGFVTNSANALCVAPVPDYTEDVTVSDCTGPVTVTQSPIVGALLGLGAHPIQIFVVNAAGRTNRSCTTSFIVRDTTTPVLICPANLVVSTAPGSCLAIVSFNTTATDNCLAVSTDCVPPSGSVFSVGTNTVVCTARDTSGNSNSCSFTVTVRDTTRPVLTCPSNLVVSAPPGNCLAAVPFNVVATDNCDTNPAVVCAPVSGSTFPVGISAVTCTARDASGNTISCSFSVTVLDTSAPVLACSTNLVVSTSSSNCSAIVNFTTSAPDNCSVVSTNCVPPSGSSFPIGANTVVCAARDASGNSNTCSFTITVRDTTPPAITCPGYMVVRPAPGDFSAVVNFNATATDNCSTVSSFECVPPPGSSFPLGENTVVCTAEDAADNTSTCSFTVVVSLTLPCLLSWKFDEGSGPFALDSSGNDILGLLTNGPARTSGVVGGALRFDGSNDRVSATDASSLNATGAVTVACWVRPESVSSTTYFVVKGNDASDQFAYALRASSAKVQYRWISPDGTKSTFGTTANVLTSGRWTHVAAAHTPGTAPVIFINGEAVPGSLSGGSVTELVGVSPFAFSVGSSADGENLFKGSIDEVFVCDGALVAAQIQNLTNGLPPGPPPPPPVPGIATASPLPDGRVGSAYSQTLLATGGTPGFTWSVINSDLPAGLTLNPNTGAITGLPTEVATNAFFIRVSDAAAQTAEQEFILAITNTPTVLARGCVVQWKFDETNGLIALDSTVNGNQGVLLNGTLRTTGMIGDAVLFDGTNDRVQMTDDTALNFTGAVTVACWVRPESVSGSRYLLIKGDQSTDAYSYAIRASDARLQYRWVSQGSIENRYGTSGSVLASGQWMHIAAVHTPGSLPILYVNGVAVPASLTSGSATAQRVISPNPFTVGSSSDGSDAFQGAMDEVVVCAAALSPSQIQGLMTGQLPTETNPFLLVELSMSGDVASISWESVPGETYRVQYKNALYDNWLDLTGDLYADDVVFRLEDNLQGQPQRFYRVMIQP